MAVDASDLAMYTARGNLVTGKLKRLMDKIESEATEYAKSISKNDTYQKYLREAFIAGVRSKANFREWQRCPICEGSGEVKNPMFGTTSGSYSSPCSVCRGAKIIERPH